MIIVKRNHRILEYERWLVGEYRGGGFYIYGGSDTLMVALWKALRLVLKMT